MTASEGAKRRQRITDLAHHLQTYQPPPFPDRDTFPHSWAKAAARLMVDAGMEETEALARVGDLSKPNLEMPRDWYARATRDVSQVPEEDMPEAELVGQAGNLTVVPVEEQT